MQIVRIAFNNYYYAVTEINARLVESKNLHIKLPILRDSLQISCWSTTKTFIGIYIKTDSAGKELYNNVF